MFERSVLLVIAQLDSPLRSPTVMRADGWSHEHSNPVRLGVATSRWKVAASFGVQAYANWAVSFDKHTSRDFLAR